MHHVILPFALSKDRNTKAVSESTFNTRQSNFEKRVVNISELKFMMVFEQERYNMTNWPFSQSWNEHKTTLDQMREAISNGTLEQISGLKNRNDLLFGNARTAHLKSLDMLPLYVEIEFEGMRRDDTKDVNVAAQNEYQTTDTISKKFNRDEMRVQRMLVYDSSLVHSELGGWEGVIKCDMKNLGPIVFQSPIGNKFTVRVSLYNYMYQPLGEMPSIELGLLFR